MGKERKKQSDEWTINELEIALAQTRVYRNGLQQAKVRLRVQPTLNGQTVRLTETERQNIRLFDYQERENEIPFSDDGSSHYRGWSAQRTYRGFSYYPDFASSRSMRHRGAGADSSATGSGRSASSVRSASTKTQGNGEWLEFYISASSGTDIHLIHISFTIRGDDGSTWSTTGYVRFPGEEEQYYGGLDVREGIGVTAEPPVLYSAENFQLDRRGIVGINEVAAGIFNDLVTVSIVAPAGRIVGIRDMMCEPAGMIHWIDNLPDTSNPCFTGHVRPGETAIRWNPAVPTGSQPLPRLSSPEPNRGAFVLCGRVDIRRGNYSNPPRGPLALSFIDEYGTRQNRQLVFVVGKRDELRIQ